jgi:hypothetical protein
MKGTGVLTKKALQSLFVSETVDTDSDVKALIRRMDVDHDNAISFADFFTRMLPYFIFEETKSPSKS